MIQIQKLSKDNIYEAIAVLDKQYGKDQESSIDFTKWLPISISDTQEDLTQKAMHNIEYLEYWVAFDDDSKTVVGVTGIYSKKDQENLAWLAWTTGIGSFQLEDTMITFASYMARGQGKLYLADFFDEDGKDSQVEQMLTRNGFGVHDIDEQSEAPDGSVHYRKGLALD